ncbi:SpoIID/LytB domain-containing protein [Lederbergia citrea]|uniref:SpoIID/LytB domain-containing protein n=1 Tax=Lederbergia citrea TaxID=2833581 RepID=A0A942URD2_9BACI|nr:SpoIID/LytB domain-containing protein [Lederbergia citrea]MBS4204764.1 SpoIID/LytB domain-containing protein [Lederbergia citrea]MBS4223388.1 SpoIID/LytB domain-containing protein [Lederbergia citrea]
MDLKRLLAVLVVFTLFIPLTTANAAVNTQNISIKLSNYIGKKPELTFSFVGKHSIKGNADIRLEESEKYIVKVEKGNLHLYDPKGKKLKELGTSFIVEADKYAEDSVQTIYGNSTKKYLGDIQFEVEDGKYVRPINLDIPFEDYLKGVVPLEMPASWNLEAVKAQSVAARTYSAGSIGKKVADTQGFQVYGGYDWHPNSTKAVDETSGKVLKYNGRLIDAVYSSSNGGYTESNSNLWGGTQLAYLPAKKDSYDPQHPWTINLAVDQIDTRKLDLKSPNNWWNSTTEVDSAVTNNLKNVLYALNDYKNTEIKIVRIPKIEFTNKNSSGRSQNASITMEFFVKDKSTNTYRMDGSTLKSFKVTHSTTANSMRNLLGTMNMKSLLVSNNETLEHTRLAGLNRFEVAVNVSKEGWSSADTVVLANWEAFGDALAATPLAYQKNAPILLTKPANLQAATKAEIQRLKPTNVIIVGGTISVSAKIEKELTSLGVKSISRIDGKSRYEVAYNISKELNPASKAVVAKGAIFADSLSIASYAARNGYPILLTGPEKLNAAAVKAIKEKAINETIVVGGEISVSKSVYNQLPSPIRIGGNNRYQVSANIIKDLNLNPSKVFIATGNSFGDALTGSVLAAKQNANMVLTPAHQLPGSVKNVLDQKLVNDFLILGGPLSVSEDISMNLPNLSIKLSGKGFGHGVGMSQYGAQEMAKKGMNYSQILSHYYPNAKLENN